VYSVQFSASKTATPKLNKTTGLKAQKLSSKSLKLNWNSTEGATKYEVWRKAGKADWKKIKTTSKRSFVQKGLVRNKTYRYRIRAFRNVGKTKSYAPYSSVVKRT
jgi:hypothetical protein